MSDGFFVNLLKILFATILYYSGILFLIFKIVFKNGLYIFNYHSFNTFTNDYFRFGSLYESRYRKKFEKQLIFFLKYFERSDNNAPAYSHLPAAGERFSFYAKSRSTAAVIGAQILRAEIKTKPAPKPQQEFS